MATTKIQAEFIATNAISGTIIADNAITTVHIAQNAITDVQIPNNSIGAVQIALNTISGTQIAQNSVTTVQLANNSVNTLNIADDQVTAAKLASDAVVTASIVDLNVTTGKIANNAVTAAKIPDGSITATQIGANAVTLAKMASLARGSILIGNSAADVAALAIGTNDYVLTSDGTDIAWEAAASGAALTGSTNNTITTVTGANAFQGEANLTFDGSTLAVTGSTHLNGKLGVGGAPHADAHQFVYTADATDNGLRINMGSGSYTGTALEVQIARQTSESSYTLAKFISKHDNASPITRFSVRGDGLTTVDGVLNISNTSAANVNNESHVLIRNLANGDIVTDQLTFNCAEDKLGVGTNLFLTGGYIRSGGSGTMGMGTASGGQSFHLLTNGRQAFNTSSTATGHANFIGEVGASMKAVMFERTNGGGEVGSIVANASSTTYNTSSDYRLKENVDYTWDATTRLKQLKPARFNWIVDDTNTVVDGFLAHEVSDIVPEAIHGEKDGMTDPVLYTVEADLDDLPEGKSIGDLKTASAPDYQGIDNSKLVPLMVKTIQELEARITTLEG